MKTKKILIAILVCLSIVCFAAFGACVDDDSASGSSSDSQTSQSSDTGTGSDDSSSGEEVDYEPHISFAEGTVTEYSAQAGEELVLPAATAMDETDGDLSADVWVKADMNNKFAEIETEETDGKIVPTFKSYTAGVHTVTYEIENSWGETDEISVTVTVTGETADGANEYSDITVLSDGGKYVENFADFKNGIAKTFGGMGNYMFLKSTDEAIEGNSVVIDYSNLQGGDNLIAMTELASYFKTGVWKVSFDVKLVSGTIDDAFLNNYYIGYRNSLGTFQTNTHIKNLCPEFSSITVGQTLRVTYDCSFVEVPQGENYYFHLFVNDLKENNVVLAYDNFEFEYRKFDISTKTATADEVKAEGGITYDFTENFTTISNAKPVEVATIEDETVKAALTAEGVTGFGSTAYMISDISDMHEIAAFPQSVFEKGYTYTFTMTYYKPANGGHNVILMAAPGTGGNKTIASNYMKTGEIGTYSVTFEYKESDTMTIASINLYGKYVAYIGSITLSAVATPVDNSEYGVTECATVTDADLKAGYTFTQDSGNESSVGQFHRVEGMLDGDVKTALSGNATLFGSNVWRIKVPGGTPVAIDALNGLFVAGDNYVITAYVYADKMSGGCALMMNSNGSQSGSAKTIEKEQISGNVYKYTIAFTAIESDYSFVFYPQGGEWDVYVGKVTVESEHVEPRDPSWAPLKDVGDKVIENFHDLKIGESSNTAYFKVIKDGDNEVLSCSFQAECNNALFFSFSGTSGETSLLQENRVYTVTFAYKNASAAFGLYFGYVPDGSGSVFGTAAALTVSEEWQTATLTFTVAATENNVQKHLQIYSGNVGNTVLIDNLTIECTAIVSKPADNSWAPLENVGDKMTENFYDLKLGTASAANNFKVVKDGENEVLSCTFEQSCNSTYFFAFSGSIDGTTALLQEGRTYTVTFRYKNANGNMNFYIGYAPDGSGSMFGTSAALTSSEEWQTATLTFTVAATENNPKKHLQIYCGNEGTVLIDDLTIECTAVND